MKKHLILKLNKKYRKLAFALAFVLFFSAFSLNTSGASVFAYQRVTEETTETTGTTGEEEGESNILTPSEGRVTFWEWEALTKKNWRKLLEDGQFHAALFTQVYYTNNKITSTRHIATYADKNHVFTSESSDKASSIGFETQSLREYYKNNDWGACIGQVCQHTYFMDQYSSVYIKQDSIGDNKVPTDHPAKFFTTKGGCLGCLWIKLEETCFPKNTALTGDKIYNYMQVALSRGSAYGNDFDTSYQSIGTGLNEKEDLFLYCRNMNRSGESDEPTLAVQYKAINDTSGRDRWRLQASTDSAGTFATISINNYKSNPCWNPGGSDHANPPWANLCWTDNRQWLNPLIQKYPKSGWDKFADALTTVGSYGLLSTDFHGDEEAWYGEYFQRLYIGTPHNFTTLKNQYIPEGKLQPYGKNHFIDANNNEAEFEGYILPEDYTIEIDGGTVVVSGNLINNGTIKIKNGGTLIIKDGGCISPYLSTKQGNIRCDDGNIIIMPGGRCYCFENEMNESPLSLTNGSTLINYGGLHVTSTRVADGCKIENRQNGNFTVGYTIKDTTSMMYNHEDNIELVEGLTTTNMKVLASMENSGDRVHIEVYRNNKIIICTNVEEEHEADLAPISRQYNGVQFIPNDIMLEFLKSHGYLDGTCNQSGVYSFNGKRALVVNEKTATFEHVNANGEDIAPASRVDIITPEY
ncbi:hypothetical protein SAMN02910369_00748 [Lachnospiraceae bacterium NE2001]|nr:hypothetical protein SAMN02910369_00748 [Lachnospiraceae bacterium NE2001]